LINTWPEKWVRIIWAWMDDQWENPSRSDHYLMRIAQRVQQTWSKEKISLEDQKISFKRKKALTQEEKIAQSKAAWRGGLAMAKRRSIEASRRKDKK